MITRKNLVYWLKKVKSRIFEVNRFLRIQIQKKPVLSFSLVLGVLFLLILLSSILGAPAKQQAVNAEQVKKVNIYTIGRAPVIRLSAKIEKTGVIQIFAQTPGVVQAINVAEGSVVDKGFVLLSLSTNYQGGDSAAIQRQIAQSQHSLISQAYDLQKDIIEKSRQVAGKTDANTDELRNISNQSLESTRSLISLNNEIISTLDKNLENYTATNSAGINENLILSTKQLKSQFMAANNGLNSSLDLTEFQAASDKPPAELSNLQKEITLKQLDIQEKTLKLNLEINQLQLKLAQLSESLMHPVSPSLATVEKVHVNLWQLVNPGTPLFTLSAKDPEVTAELLVNREIAQAVSRMESSTFYIGSKTFETIPRYISTEAVDGQQYSVLYSIPQQYWQELTNKGYISVDVPIGLASTSRAIPFIPIDSVYQTQDTAYVFVEKDAKAVSKTVSLGTVYGRFVEVISGLDEGDKVIMDRNVVWGDRLSVIH